MGSRPVDDRQVESRYRLSVLFVGECRRFELVSSALSKSGRVKYNARQFPAGGAPFKPAQRPDYDVLIVDACDDDSGALRLLAETDRRGSAAARVILAPVAAETPPGADALLPLDGLTTDAIERCIARALSRRHACEAQTEKLAQHEIQPSRHEACVIVDHLAAIQSLDEIAERLFGYGSTELAGRPLATLFPNADLVASTTSAGTDVWAAHRSGRAIPVHVALEPIDAASGNARTLLRVQDLSECKEKESHLRESQRFLQATLNALSARIAILDERGTIMAVNEAWSTFAQAHPSLVRTTSVGANYLEACMLGMSECGGEGSRTAQGIRQVMLGQRQEFQLQYAAFLSASEKRWFVVRATRSRAHGPCSVVVAHEDVTELHQAEDSLADLSRQNQLILNSVSEGIVGFDSAGRTIFVNHGAADMTGWSVNELVLAGAHDFLHQTADDFIHSGSECPICATLSDGQTRHHDSYAFRRQHGGVFPAEFTCAPIWESGRLVGAVLTFRDVSERKQLQAQLLQAQKLESIGQLAAGIAHEINTPIQYIGDNTRFLRDAFRDLSPLFEQIRTGAERPELQTITADWRTSLIQLAQRADLDYLREEIPKAIEQSLEGAERVAAIVRAMKEFAHPGTAEKTAVDLNRAIQSTIAVARNEWKYVADVITDFDTDLPAVPCLPGEINQVVLNLLVNAAHAIADVVAAGKLTKGEIRISTRLCGEWAEIRVADNGTGIAPENQNRVFDPFFSTKAVGQGTGQGLALAHAVIREKHGGTISLETELGRGTCFMVRLPMSDAASDAIALDAPAPQLAVVGSDS